MHGAEAGFGRTVLDSDVALVVVRECYKNDKQGKKTCGIADGVQEFRWYHGATVFASPSG